MPFSFIDIEESKTRAIGWVFFFILLFYFLTAYLVLAVLENFLPGCFSLQRQGIAWIFPLNHLAFAFGLALVAALIHWFISTENLIPKMTLAVGALEIDAQDSYHHFLQNIVDEVCVAIGGRKIEAMVIPSASCNAFALEDFKGRAVIGVTEGLLARLNRAQLEAVVAHEAGHIVSRDSVSTTVIASLAELYQESLEQVSRGLSRTRGRGGLPLLFIYLVLGVMNFLSRLLHYFISRQREYRADAIAVRLTRDPLSLAEALKLISTHWRGEGASGEKIESIFIVNPKYNQLDESEGALADIFSTHPPIRNRVRILLDMAHLDENTLEKNLKNFKRVSPVAVAEIAAEELSGFKRWSVFIDQRWQGPYSLQEACALKNFLPEQWVRQDGAAAVKQAYEDVDLRQIFNKDKGEAKKSQCPHCQVDLRKVEYEGAPVLKCNYCAGTFIEQHKVSRILIREDKEFSEEITRLAKTAIAEKEKSGLKNPEGKDLWLLTCPDCARLMRRQFFVYSYPVEIDRCFYCAGVWFDRTELEVLQYIYTFAAKNRAL